MNKEFWDIIEQAKTTADGREDRPEALKNILALLSEEKIIKFRDLYYQKLVELYRWDLWGAAFAINGGCSDDGFEYWRDFLISEGEEVCTNALKSPESLADLENIEDAELEEYRYAIEDAYNAVTGSDFPEFTIHPPGDPVGDEWEEEDLPRLYPKLTAKYGNV